MSKNCLNGTRNNLQSRPQAEAETVLKVSRRIKGAGWVCSGKAVTLHDLLELDYMSESSGNILLYRGGVSWHYLRTGASYWIKMHEMPWSPPEPASFQCIFISVVHLKPLLKQAQHLRHHWFYFCQKWEDCAPEHCVLICFTTQRSDFKRLETWMF